MVPISVISIIAGQEAIIHHLDGGGTCVSGINTQTFDYLKQFENEHRAKTFVFQLLKYSGCIQGDMVLVYIYTCITT